jgi:DNA-binding transcriptional MerR regulator
MPRRPVTVDYEPVLKVTEVAALFRVEPSAVRRWEATGKIPREACSRTPGGHRRYSEAAIRSLYEQAGMAGGGPP